jgi:hypothetical protein
MKIIAVIFFLFGFWMISCFKNLNLYAGKKENIRNISFFLVGCLLMYISLKMMGVIKF